MTIERARPVRQPPPIDVERSRPRRDARAVRERPAPRRGSRVERGRPLTGVEGGAPDLRRRTELEDLENAGHRPRKPGRGARHGHPRGRHGHGGYHRHRHHYGCGHYGFGYDPFYYGFGYSPFAYWGLGSYYGRSYYAPTYYAPDVYVVGGGSSRGSGAAMGALDLDVRPDKAEVYVDGNFVGVADQYDGYPSYLWLEEGTYELAFFKEGYETVFLRYTIYPRVTIDVDVRLREGESIRPRPPPELPEGYPAGRDPALPGGDDVGRLAIAATPADAALYLDGHFVGTAEEIAQLAAGLIVEPGDHLVEVTRPGYASESIPISVSAGEQIDVKLDLEKR